MDPIVYTTKPKADTLPGFYEPDYSVNIMPVKQIKCFKNIPYEDAFVIQNALTKEECEILIDFMHTSNNFEEVGVQGMMDVKDERIGSLRTSIWCPDVANQIWTKINNVLPCVDGKENVLTDWWQHLSKDELKENITYKPVAISPLLRFMKYGNNGQHYAHYDAGYIYPDNQYRTLKSVVIYLTTNEGAATRFIKDKQDNIPIWDRNHNDWDREVNENEIIDKSECIQGNILIFNHRMCHDVEKYLGTDNRIIIRGDVVYKRF